MKSFKLYIFIMSGILLIGCSMKAQYTNKLIKEKSPYLLMHAHNPVDWYPWGKEAFTKAEKENKPIFLSIGYSTCHWCHVMEKESFEDKEIAKILNKNFISIKVDREERPDIDSIYMKISMIMTGSGGWPLTILMTPNQKPFYAGTYLPKENMYGRIGLKDLLLKTVELWHNNKEKLFQISGEVFKNLENQEQGNHKDTKLGKEILHTAYTDFKNNFDHINGGFGTKPKFPSMQNYLYLLRYWNRTEKETALTMTKFSLEKMRLGGIYDHIGFGFHRYSTDQKWFIPHFEKMLYDQAMTSMVYAETYQATKKSFYKKTAEEIFDYIIKTMHNEKGGFYSSEDADSENKEGKFYLWTFDEINKNLGKDADLFDAIFNVTKQGNYKEEAGQNILYLKEPLKNISKKMNLDYKELQLRVDQMRKKLFNTREKRIHPLKDDKILADWNGLMIVALAKGAQIFNHPIYSQYAKESADFIMSTMKTKDGGLYHRYRKGEVRFNGYLDDYAFMIWGLIEIYEATFETKYLAEALKLQDYAIENFWDESNGGFFFTSKKTTKKLLVRSKKTYDGAYPSGNSVMLYNLARFSKMTGNLEYEKKAELMIRTFGAEVKQSPLSHTMFLIGFDFLVNKTFEIVVASENQHSNEIIRTIYDKYIPNSIFLLKFPDANIETIAPYTKELSSIHNKPTAYVCENFSCNLPTTNTHQLEKLLQK